jgi:hypothetical protein
MEDPHGGVCRVGQGPSTTEAAAPALRVLVRDISLCLHCCCASRRVADCIGCCQVFDDAQEDDPVFDEYSGLLAKFVADSNVNAQVSLAMSFVVISPMLAGRCVQQGAQPAGPGMGDGLTD